MSFHNSALNKARCASGGEKMYFHFHTQTPSQTQNAAKKTGSESSREVNEEYRYQMQLSLWCGVNTIG